MWALSRNPCFRHADADNYLIPTRRCTALAQRRKGRTEAAAMASAGDGAHALQGGPGAAACLDVMVRVPTLAVLTACSLLVTVVRAASAVRGQATTRCSPCTAWRCSSLDSCKKTNVLVCFQGGDGLLTVCTDHAVRAHTPHRTCTLLIPTIASLIRPQIPQKVDVERVIEIAVAAGDAIMEVYNQPESEWGVESKADDTPLTLADSRANDIICSGLARLGAPLRCCCGTGGKWGLYGSCAQL